MIDRSERPVSFLDPELATVSYGVLKPTADDTWPNKRSPLWCGMGRRRSLPRSRAAQRCAVKTLCALGRLPNPRWAQYHGGRCQAHWNAASSPSTNTVRPAYPISMPLAMSLAPLTGLLCHGTRTPGHPPCPWPGGRAPARNDPDWHLYHSRNSQCRSERTRSPSTVWGMVGRAPFAELARGQITALPTAC